MVRYKVLERVTGGSERGFSQQYHYWPRNLNRKKGEREKREKGADTCPTRESDYRTRTN
jgi:hypothetical protein